MPIISTTTQMKELVTLLSINHFQFNHLNSFTHIFLHDPHYNSPFVGTSHKSLPDKSTYIHLIRNLMKKVPDHTLCLTDGSKLKNRMSYAYSINGDITSHRVRNIASIFTATHGHLCLPLLTDTTSP